MAFGLLPSGLSIKRLTEIQTEIESGLRAVFGDAINLLPTSVLGQLVGIFSEREALIWESLQAVDDSQSPSKASDISLDFVVSLTGISRLAATKSLGNVNAKGVLATVIPQGSIISVAGNPSAVFETTVLAAIGAGTDEIQDITFSATPDAGDFTIIFDGEETALIAFSANAAAVETALNNLTNLSAVTVAGSFGAGFTVTFAGADGSQDQPLMQEGNTNTLELVSVPVTISIAETTPGLLPNVDIDIQAVTAGETEAFAGTLTVIETVIAGWDSVTNPLDIVSGNNIETDAELRARRLKTLAAPGAGTINAIRAELLEIDEVEAAVVFQNITDVTDAFGRPPHSVAPVVLGGDEDELAAALFNVVAAGIAYFGSITKIVVDSQGFDQEIKFSRPTEVDIFLEIDITTDSDFPSGGETAIVTEILAFTDANFSVADEVITTKLFEAVHNIDGVTDVELRIDTSNIALVQLLTMDSDFVTGNTIDLDVAGSAIVQVPFNTDQGTTLIDLAAAIQARPEITTATVTGAREITVTSAVAGVPGPMSNFLVAGGATQPLVVIETTSHTDDNIPIAADEISAFDSSRIVVTDIT